MSNILFYTNIVAISGEFFIYLYDNNTAYAGTWLSTLTTPMLKQVPSS